MRNRFLAGETVGDGQRQHPGGRRRQNLSIEGEHAVLAPFLEHARNGGILVVPQIKAELESALGRHMALSSVYNLLHRHGWRKLAPDKLMFQDEARFGRINDVRRCWAPLPVRPLCRAMLTHEYTYAYGAVDVVSGELDSLILPHVNTDCMQIFLDEVGARHPQHRIIVVLDGAGWHAGTALKPPRNMQLLSLPPYAPELNPVEHLWDELREKFFHNKAFDSIDALEDQLEMGLRALENDMPRVQSIVAWNWIVTHKSEI